MAKLVISPSAEYGRAEMLGNALENDARIIRKGIYKSKVVRNILIQFIFGQYLIDIKKIKQSVNACLIADKLGGFFKHGYIAVKGGNFIDKRGGVFV